MVRYGNLYEKIASIENIKTAHSKAQKGKSYYKEVKMVNSKPNKYFNEIRNMLVNKTFKNSAYTKMIKYTNNGKKREIFKLPYFPDRIIHHCIMNVIEPIWQSTLIRDTYSAIKDRGIHDGVNRIKKGLKDKANTKYCLKLDIKKFYPSIDNELLKQTIRNKIKDEDLLWLFDEIIDSAKGVPIGNYLSQYFGNLFLSPFDHWIKEQKQIKYYYRYCDDIVIFNADKNYLHQLKKEIEEYLINYKLSVKNNWQVFPVSVRGVDFLGYRFFHNYTLVRKSIAKKFINRVNYIKKNYNKMNSYNVINSIMSYMGWLKYANSKNLFNSKVDNELFFIVKQKSKEISISNPLQGFV